MAQQPPTEPRPAADRKPGRGRARREHIVAAAAGLFRRHGFHGTGVHDIGSAVGMTGPGLYRHFKNKDELLTTIAERAVRRHQAILREVRARELAPAEAVRQLVELSVQTLFENRDIMASFARELPSLPAPDRDRLERRLDLIRDEWAELARHARPDLEAEEARLLVDVVLFGMLQRSTQLDHDLDPARARRLLADLATAAFFAGEGSVLADTPRGGSRAP